LVELRVQHGPSEGAPWRATVCTVLACPRARACGERIDGRAPRLGGPPPTACAARQEWGALVFESRRFVELRKQTFWTQFLSNESFGMGVFYTLNVFCIQAGPRPRAAVLPYTCPAASGGGVAVSQLGEHLQLCGAALVGVAGARSGCACITRVPRWVCWARAGSRMHGGNRQHMRPLFREEPCERMLRSPFTAPLPAGRSAPHVAPRPRVSVAGRKQLSALRAAQFYLGTTRLQLEHKGDANGYTYTGIANVVPAFGFLGIPVISWLLDKQARAPARRRWRRAWTWGRAAPGSCSCTSG